MHVADTIAVVSAKLADFGALSTHALVLGRVDEHHVRGCATHLPTCHHDPKVLWFNVFATLLQAMRHGRADASLIATETLLDTVP